LLGAPATVVTVSVEAAWIADVPIVAVIVVASPAWLLGVQLVLATPEEVVVVELGDSVLV
jgi:hypothetical protein